MPFFTGKYSPWAMEDNSTADRGTLSLDCLNWLLCDLMKYVIGGTQ